jgi:hypothetical protein
MVKKPPPRGAKRGSLAAATLSLLGAAAPAQAQAPADATEPQRWSFDTGVLLYSESDGRVQAAEPVVNATLDLGDERKLSFKLVLDALTGATPNGAAPASTPQTFTQPSGKGTFIADPGEVPLDGTFRDTRVAIAARRTCGRT